MRPSFHQEPPDCAWGISFNPDRSVVMRVRLMIPALGMALGAASASIAADAYRLEKSHVDLLFSINHAGFTEKHGSFHDLDATLQYDAAHPEKSQVTVT